MDAVKANKLRTLMDGLDVSERFEKLAAQGTDADPREFAETVLIAAAEFGSAALHIHPDAENFYKVTTVVHYEHEDPPRKRYMTLTVQWDDAVKTQLSETQREIGEALDDLPASVEHLDQSQLDQFAARLRKLL